MATIASGLTPSYGRDSGGSSAPVLEFVCLFTHDLRRKQKRWQDGRVKYHLFNKRVMVYDDRGNVIGDMYWRRDWEFGEGEEVETERGGAIVQVAECVGRQNQDLSELLDKRAKEKEQRAAARPAAPPVPMHTPLSVARTPIQREHLQARHRPLNQLLGMPSGHHGRAVVSTESPYEQRHTPGQTPDGQSNPQHQASKRRRFDDSPPSKMGYAQSLFGTQLTLSGGPMSSAPIRRPAAQRSQPRVDISSSAENGSEDARHADAIDESNYRSSKRPNMHDSRRNPGWAEQASQAPGNLSTASRVSTNNEPITLSVDTEKRGVKEPGNTSNRRGVSSDFSHASDESQGRASLLRGMGMGKGMGTKAGLSRNVGAAMTEKGSRTLDEAETRQQAHRSAEPEQGIVLNEEVEVLEQETARLPDRHEVVAKSKRVPPEPQNQPNPKRRKDLGQSIPPLVAHTDAGAVIPAAQGPGAAIVTEVQKEPRTELRLKSRQKRGLLVLSEMAKKSKVQRAKEKEKRPSESLRFSEEYEESQQGNAHEQLDREMPEIPAGQGPVSADSEDEDPFASSLPKSTQTVLMKPARNQWKSTKERYVAEDQDGDDPFGARSPEPTNSSKNVGKKPTSSEFVHDISDDTDDGDAPLQIEKTAKPKLKEPGKKLDRGKTTTKAQSAEDIGSEPENSPPNRSTRASRRKVDKGSREENSAKASRGRSKKKRQLSESDPPEEGVQEDLPKAPARPRMVKLSRKSVKSREVFGFCPSSSPLPPTFGPGSPPARPIPQAVHDPIPALNINDDIRSVANPANTGRNIPSRNMPSTSVPSLQPRNPLPHTYNGGIEDAEVILEAADRTVQPSNEELNRKGLGRVLSTVHVVGRITPSVNRPTSPTVSGMQTIIRPNEIAAGAEKNVGRDEQPDVHAEESCGLHAESHKAASSPQRRPTAIIARPEQSLPSPGPDGPVRPTTVPTEILPVAVAPPVPTEVRHVAIPPAPAEVRPVAVPAPVLPKIVNPASRGRKAALKSDAAGQTPQSILPPVEPVNLLARAAVRPGAATAGVEQRPKLKMTFPGFASAREGAFVREGGPWSREAHDLLEFGIRPP